MSLKKNKQARNAFYYFLEEFKEKAVRNGYDIDNPEIEEEAGIAWRNLSPQSRIRYKEIAFEKRKESYCLENKFTITGVSYAQLQREEMERSRQEEFMINEIETTVRPLSGCLLKTTVFHFIHVNTYCRLLDGHFLPCEIGIAKFNFESGVKDSFHSIISLECIPTGYFFECKRNSEGTHQIPLPSVNSLGERDTEKILKQIEAFLSDRGEFPPVYTLQPYIEAVQDTLTTFANGRDIFRVYPIARLLFELRNACANEAGGVGFPVLSLAEREFEKDHFNLSPGISCYYHEGMDACQYCSLSIVKRWCFLFASLGCPDLGINLKAGCHKPRKITLSPAPPEPTTSKTQVSSRKGRNGPPMVIPPPITIIDYSSPKPSADAGNEGSNSDSPLAQFGTYIRALPDESKKVKSKSENYNMLQVNYNEDTTCPSSKGNTTNTRGQNLQSWSKSYVDQEKCVKSYSRRIIQHPIERDVKEQENTIVNDEEQRNHPNFIPVHQSRINVTDTNLQRFEISESYSKFVNDANEVPFQNCESIPKQPPDIFDTYVDSMFKPIQKQPSDNTIKSKPVEKYEALQLGSLAHQFRKEDSMPFTQNRNYLGYNTENCGHGRGIAQKLNTKKRSLILPGQEVLDALKAVLQKEPATKVEEQELTRNGVSRSVRLPGRGRARARGLSHLLE